MRILNMDRVGIYTYIEVCMHVCVCVCVLILISFLVKKLLIAEEKQRYLYFRKYL